MFLLVGIGCHVTHVVHAFGAVAVFDREAGAVQREADTAPCAVKAFVHLDGRHSIHAGDLGGGGNRHGLCAGGGGLGLLLAHAELDHHAAQEFGLEFGVDRARLPHGGVLLLRAVDLDHAAMAHEDVGAAVGVAFKARTETVALARGVQAVKQLADARTDDVLRDLGAVFRPVGFQNAEFGVVGGEHEAALEPEITHRIPELVGWAVDHQPALVAVTLDAHVSDGGGGSIGADRLLRLTGLIGDRRGSATRDVVARVARELR